MKKVLMLLALLVVVGPLGLEANEAHGLVTRVESGNGYIRISFSSITLDSGTTVYPPINNGSFTGTKMYQVQVYNNVITDSDSRKEMLSTATAALSTGLTLKILYNLDTLKHVRLTTE
jgi:hypothetical protein